MAGVMARSIPRGGCLAWEVVKCHMRNHCDIEGAERRRGAADILEGERSRRWQSSSY